MRPFLSACVMLTAIISFPQTVFADTEIYKCKTAKGKTIYSESPCDGMATKRMEVLDNPVDSSGLRLEVQNSNNSATNSSHSENQETGSFPSRQMPEPDKQNRIRENLIAAKSTTATAEKKSDALTENAMLNKSIVKPLDYEDNLKRRNLKVDLDSADQSQRYNAMNQLRTLYHKY